MLVLRFLQKDFHASTFHRLRCIVDHCNRCCIFFCFCCGCFFILWQSWGTVNKVIGAINLNWSVIQSVGIRWAGISTLNGYKSIQRISANLYLEVDVWRWKKILFVLNFVMWGTDVSSTASSEVRVSILTLSLFVIAAVIVHVYFLWGFLWISLRTLHRCLYVFACASWWWNCDVVLAVFWMFGSLAV